MNKFEIQKIQKKIGVDPDGVWGPLSKSALRSYLLSKGPSPCPWPDTSEESLKAFYGDPWDNEPIVAIEAPEWLRLYDGEARVRFIQCHKKVADSLLRALNAAYEVAPDVAKRYFGCHVDRNMRGGSRPSLHAYGAAIDLDASTNRNKQSWPESATMPLSVMEAFATEGWMPAGAAWGRDSMHFQATRWG